MVNKTNNSKETDSEYTSNKLITHEMIGIAKEKIKYGTATNITCSIQFRQSGYCDEDVQSYSILDVSKLVEDRLKTDIMHKIYGEVLDRLNTIMSAKVKNASSIDEIYDAVYSLRNDLLNAMTPGDKL